MASDFPSQGKIARLFWGMDSLGFQKSLRFFLKEEGRGTRNGHGASKGSKGISGI